MNKYALLIVNSNKVSKCLTTLCKDKDMKNDLFQFCILKLLDKDELKFKKLVDNNSVEDYFIGMLYNQMNSNTSEFFKVYKNNGFNKNVYINDMTFDTPDIEFDIEERINKDIEQDLLIKRINDGILKCDPLKIDLFNKKYFEDMTYQEISEYYNIKRRSVINKINTVKRQIKCMFNQNVDFSELRRIDHRNRRILLGKILITDDVKKDIIRRFDNGETKTQLSIEYQLS